jgi:hypothetical protein
MDLQYPGNEGELVQFPSSDIDQTSSPQPSPNADEFDHFQWDPSDFDLDGDHDAEPIPANLDPSESDLGSVPADSSKLEVHPFINGTLS